MISPKINYQIIDSIEEVKDVILSQKVVVVDTETTGLETHSSKIKIIGVGLCWAPGEAVYIRLDNKPDTSIELKRIESILLDNPNIEKWGQNLKFDLRMFIARGLKVQNVTHDSNILNYCLMGDRVAVGFSGGHGIDEMALYYLNYIKIRTKSLIPKKSKSNKNPSMLDSDQSKVAVYCMEDCDMTYRVICIQLNMLNSKDFQHVKQLYDLESKVAPVLVKMETNGVYIDIERLASIKARMLELQEKTIQHAKDLLGADFSLSNRDEIENIVYNTYNLDKSYNVEVKTTKTGKKSIDKKTLARFSDNEFVKTYLDAKGREKNIKTYVEPLTEMLSDITGYLHGWFNQTVTTTGRLSSSNPNLQNQPTRSEEGKLIRSLYRSRWKDTGGMILSADYSQCEIRILAHMSDEPIFLEAYKNNKDVHTFVASLLYNCDYDKVTKEQRSLTKTVNFGLIYGMGIDKLMAETGLTKEQAEDFLKAYLAKLNYVDKWLNKTREFLRQNGYTETLFGRRRYLPDIYSSKKWKQEAAQREACNHPIQGCLHGDSKIFLKGIGETNIADCSNKKVEIWDGNKFVTGTVIPSGLKQVTYIKLSNGLEINCSPDHKFKVVSTSNKIFWKTARELVHNSFNKKSIRNLRVLLSDEVTNWFGPVVFKPAIRGNAHNSKLVDLNTLSDKKELGHFLGRIASDGTIGKDNGNITLIVAEHEKELIPYLVSICKKLTNVKIRRRIKPGYAPVYSIMIHCKSLANQLLEMGIKNRIPIELWRDSTALGAYLQGMFDGDGTACKSGDGAILAFGRQDKSPKWAKEIQRALQYLGIRTRCRIYSGSSVRLQILKADMPIFMKKVGFLKKSKQALGLLARSTKTAPAKYGKAYPLKYGTFTDKMVPMYDVLETETHQFAVNGIVTHNSNADITKLAMISVHNRMIEQKLESKMILQVHDELVFDVHPKELEVVKELVLEIMPSVVNLKVPLVCEAQYGESWATAH